MCEVCDDIGMLDIIEEFEQWPESLDAEADDIPVEIVSRPSYAEAARVRNVSFAEEMRVREEEARRLAELNTAMAVERLEEIERLKCEVESETARAFVVEQNTQIARLTEQLESQRIRLELTAGAQQMRAAVDEELKSAPVGRPLLPSLSR